MINIAARSEKLPVSLVAMFMFTSFRPHPADRIFRLALEAWKAVTLIVGFFYFTTTFDTSNRPQKFHRQDVPHLRGQGNGLLT